jgi:hypothetical protein
MDAGAVRRDRVNSTSKTFSVGELKRREARSSKTFSVGEFFNNDPSIDAFKSCRYAFENKGAMVCTSTQDRSSSSIELWPILVNSSTIQSQRKRESRSSIPVIEKLSTNV